MPPQGGCDEHCGSSGLRTRHQLNSAVVMPRVTIAGIPVRTSGVALRARDGGRSWGRRRRGFWSQRPRGSDPGGGLRPRTPRAVEALIRPRASWRCRPRTCSAPGKQGAAPGSPARAEARPALQTCSQRTGRPGTLLCRAPQNQGVPVSEHPAQAGPEARRRAEVPDRRGRGSERVSEGSLLSGLPSSRMASLMMVLPLVANHRSQSRGFCGRDVGHERVPADRAATVLGFEEPPAGLIDRQGVGP
jgi:hypothetical protein